MKHRDGSYKPRLPYGSISNVKGTSNFSGPWDYDEGVVATKFGFVKVYAQGNDRTSKPSTWLRFVWNGRMHDRNFDVRFTPRRMVTLADRFAREIARGGK